LASAGEKPRSRPLIVTALTQVAPAGLPALAKLIEDQDTDVRKIVILTLARPGRTGTELAPALIKALHDTGPATRLEAMRGGGRLGTAAGAAAPTLSEMLKTEPEVGRRIVLAEALAYVQGHSPTAMTTLTEALGNRNLFLRREAARALGRIGSEARAAVPALRK